MWLIDRIVEARVQEAIARGEFDDLPGAGQPLNLDDNALVPEELRGAYRLLKNAGYVPEEITLRREISDVEQLLTVAQSEEARGTLNRRLQHLLLRLDLAAGGSRDLRHHGDYFDKLVVRLTARRDNKV
jgi:hypothetical protein